jgi:adenylyltransferase/sulfurtransferase
VTIGGIGALGTHLANCLVRAGVGRLTLIDRDIVEMHNLQRQVLFDEADARDGTPKAAAAVAHLAKVDSACELVAIAEEFTAATFAALVPRPDLLLDGTDNFATRYLINDLAIAHGIPWIYGAALASEGMAMAVLPGETPCLRCLVPAATGCGEATCETAGILQPTIAAVTAFQTAQALKILAHRTDLVARGVFVVDVWRDHYAMQFTSAARSAECPCCARGEFPALAADAAPAVTLCGRDAVQVRPAAAGTLDIDALAARLAGLVQVTRTPHLLRFEVDGCRFSVFPGGRALIFGVADTGRGLALYDRWIGGR